MLFRMFTAGCLVLCTTSAIASEDGRIRMRAREHYEEVRFSVHDTDSKKYVGFTNTINAWYEVPFHYSIGIAGSPIFARLFTKDAALGLGKEIRLVHLGAEGKSFPLRDTLPAFFRLGVYQVTLTSNSDAGKLKGTSYLAGVGYEFKLGDIGLAPEMSWRKGSLREDVNFSGTAPCIGLHFYKAL